MKKLIVFPTWVLMKLMRPFLPKENFFKKNNITLSNWAENSTDLNDAFSRLFWVIILFLGVVIPLYF